MNIHFLPRSAEIKRLNVFRDVFTVYSESYKCTNSFCEQNAKLTNVNSTGRYSCTINGSNIKHTFYSREYERVN